MESKWNQESFGNGEEIGFGEGGFGSARAMELQREMCFQIVIFLIVPFFILVSSLLWLTLDWVGIATHCYAIFKSRLLYKTTV